MTTSTPPPEPTSCPAGHGPPTAVDDRVDVDSKEFAADPFGAYRHLRATHGPVAPAYIGETPVTLITGFREALQVLGDPGYSADPRAWQSKQQNQDPDDCPALPVLGWRPDVQHAAGLDRARLRQSVVAAIKSVDQLALEKLVKHSAVTLINQFCEAGCADLLAQFAVPLVHTVVDHMLGLAYNEAEYAFEAIMELRELRAGGSPRAVEHSHHKLVQAMTAAVAAKAAEPGPDLTSWLLHHTDREDRGTEPHQLAMVYRFATEPVWNLIANVVLMTVTDDRAVGDVLGGAMSTRDGIDAVLFTDPPVTSCVRYPTQMKLMADAWLSAHEPVLISLAASTTDPVVEGAHTGNRSYLAFGAGEHECPDAAKTIALLITRAAVDELMDALPDITLAEPVERLTRLPGPFDRALGALPVTFPASPPLQII